MVTRREILGQAANECMKELYSLAQPAITWEDFLEECKKYNKKHQEWEAIKGERPGYLEYCGPKPYEFHYLPKEVLKEIFDSYVDAYKIDRQEELKSTIDILKSYFASPIVDKYIKERVDKYGNHHPGYRGYAHPKSLQVQLEKIIGDKDKALKSWKRVKKFFDMAGNFYNWNGELNAFGMEVYLGASPHSNKDTVIENWKKYRGVDIVIDENKYKNDDDDDDDDEKGSED